MRLVRNAFPEQGLADDRHQVVALETFLWCQVVEFAGSVLRGPEVTDRAPQALLAPIGQTAVILMAPLRCGEGGIETEHALDEGRLEGAPTVVGRFA